MKWKPKHAEKYWFIETLNKWGIRKTVYWENTYNDEYRVRTGNFFKTRKEAQAKLKQILELLKK